MSKTFDGIFRHLEKNDYICMRFQQKGKEQAYDIHCQPYLRRRVQVPDG